MKVDKAARYIGGEVNSVMKDKNAVDIRFAMCFPDVYRTHLIPSAENNIWYCLVILCTIFWRCRVLFGIKRQ